MKTQDWTSVVTPTALLVGENSTLQWSDEIIEHVMFMDYYFRPKPYDLGERSRYTEAKTNFDHIADISCGRYRPEQLYATNLCLDPLERAPKGKRLLIPEAKAAQGLKHIRKILKDNPSIETVFVMSMQANYWLQKLGFYGDDAAFMHGAQPRNAGLDNVPPYYQPVDGKVFGLICGNIYEAKGLPVKVVPIVSAKDYPLREANLERYGKAYETIQGYFRGLKP